MLENALTPRTELATVALGEVCRRHQEISRDAGAAGFGRFVKVEHITSGRLKLANWGSVGEEEMPPTFYNVFRSGHVLFPSRNPHLRRVATPDFDGICGEKTFVLEECGGLAPGLLKFILQSDALVEHAVGMRIGSTNPHVRWRDLASFQFKLPSRVEQERILTALEAAEETLERCIDLLQASEALREAFLNDFFLPRFSNGVPLKSVAEIKSGGTPPKSKSELWGGGLPWASGKDLKVRELGSTEDSLTEQGWNVAKIAPKNATLIVVRGMILAHTFPVSMCKVPMAFNQDLRAIIAGPLVRPEYIAAWAEWIGPWLLARSAESSHGTKRLERDTVESAAIPVESLDLQDEFVLRYETILEGLRNTELRLNEATQIKRKLLLSFLSSQ